MAERNDSGFLQVAELRFRELAVTDPAIPDLNGVVAVRGLSLHLRDDIALSEADDGDRNNFAAGIEK